MSNQSTKTPPTFAERIKVMFDDAEFTTELVVEIHAVMFSDQDPDDVLMFFAALNACFDRGQKPEFLYSMMDEAFKRTDAHRKAFNGYIEQLLKPTRQKGGKA